MVRMGIEVSILWNCSRCNTLVNSQC